MFKTPGQLQVNSDITLATNNSSILVENSYGKDRFLRISEVMKITSLKKSTLYRKIQESTFPKQVKIGARSSVWKLSDVSQWMKSPMEFKEFGASA